VENLENLCDFATAEEILKAKYESYGKHQPSSRIKPVAMESLVERDYDYE
jgi:hypothetical protein